MSCERCSDSGWLFVEGKGVAECPCVAQGRAVKRLDRAGIPPRYQARTLDSFDSKMSRWAAAGLVQARGFVREYPNQRDRGLMFSGPCGVGKTHLAIGILLECHRQYAATVRFVELRELFGQIKATFAGNGQRREESEHNILRPLIEAEILVIDEVGAARDTDWQRETTEKLINGRYNANLATLCTTNYANHEPGWQPASQPSRTQSAGDSFRASAQLVIPAVRRVDTLGDRIGMPMWSRLQEMCRTVEMDGEDVRTTRRKA